MKLFSTYLKEMKIAFRGFYFYIEIFVALVVLIVLLVAVKENPENKSVEYLYSDLPAQMFEASMDKDLAEGRIELLDDVKLEIKASEFVLLNKETGLEEVYALNKEKTVTASAYKKIDSETGLGLGKVYILDNEEDMIRLAHNSGKLARKMSVDASGSLTFKYYLQGFETERYEEMLYISHGYNPEDLLSSKEGQMTVEIGSSATLNSREAIIPVYVAFAGALMGFFIIMSYVFLDKSQGVIKAFSVTPAPVWHYLISKIFVLLTTVVISASIVVIPVMKLKPDYLFFYIFLIAASFAFSSLGLLVASFFDTISKAFGILYLIMMVLIVPAFSYYIGSFDPLWIRFLPTYPLLEGLKGILVGQTDFAYVLTYTGAFLIGGVIILALANVKFKKSLTV